jgi:hypothetical protein
MSCVLCASSYQAELSAEIMIHFSGLRNLDKPGILAFPKVLICLDCGFSQFTVPETEVALLRIHDSAIEPSSGASVERRRNP